MSGYEIDLDHLCRNQSFLPEEVVSSDLVFPKGAVPNSQLLWIRIELKSGDKTFVTRSLAEFHDLVKLPESSIGGWTEGERGSDAANLAHLKRYAQEDDDSIG